VHQRLRDLLEQIADAPGVAEIEVQVVDDDQEDAAGRIVARARDRKDQPFLLHRRWRRCEIVDAAAVHQRQRGNVLLHAVFVNLEVVLREVGDKLVLAVTRDDIGRDVVDGHTEGGLGLGCGAEVPVPAVPVPGVAGACGAGAWGAGA
jgi:hypothetical protein